jgi:uncharacterized protein YyaL (SSP411 family)
MNRLRHEKSPYLLQHADNPVDWYPWGEEAFLRAEMEDRPVFLSIGYSTCHWCHVMAHESFEDGPTAQLLNDAFVCVKVDREERPDIDGVYMRACQMMTGSGGWPLTIVMTPRKRPFFAATYIPRKSWWGREGLVDLVPRLVRLWRTERERIESGAGELLSLLRGGAGGEGEEGGAAGEGPSGGVSGPAPGEAAGPELLSTAFQEFRGQFDGQYAGFGVAPKFPMPHQLLFLARHGQRTGRAEATLMAAKTLRAMRRGGIFDQLGFGFHRYSTDRQWLIPHFEKMLYDQALCVLAALELFRATADGEHARIAREALEYVLRDLRSPEGAFYAAEDADSEGEEGRFYLWDLREVRRLLADEAAFAAEQFGLTAEGNFVDPLKGKATGLNILFLEAGPGLAPAEGRGNGAATERTWRLEEVRRSLLAARDGRVRPRRDEKILADWNGLMIAALARAAWVLGDPAYLAAAREAADFVLFRMRTPEGRLLHRWCSGEAAVTGNLDDYAFTIWGLIELYAAGFDPRDLRTALALQRVLRERFRDPAGGFFFTPDDAEELPARLKESHDGAIPSGNAVTFTNLIRLGRMTGDPALEEEATALAHAFAAPVRRLPSAHAQWLLGWEMLTAPSCEVVIAGDPEAADTRALIEAVRRNRGQEPILLLRPPGEGDGIAAMAPFTRAMAPLDGRAAAHVCRNFACLKPVTGPEELERLLAGTGKAPAR